MLWSVTGRTQLGEVNATHDHGWKGSRVGFYRRSESTWDTGRRGRCIQYLKYPRNKQAFYYKRILPYMTVRYLCLYAEHIQQLPCAVYGIVQPFTCKQGKKHVGNLQHKNQITKTE